MLIFAEFLGNAASAHSSLTRDIDILIHREDLARVVSVAGQHGFRFRHSAGLDMLLYGESNSARLRHIRKTE